MAALDDVGDSLPSDNATGELNVGTAKHAGSRSTKGLTLATLFLIAAMYEIAAAVYNAGVATDPLAMASTAMMLKAKEISSEDQGQLQVADDVTLPVPTFNASCTPTVLASYPGSGSTITRLLIEMATGVWTGSIYGDQSLFHATPHAFLGEMTTEHVVAVKTHGPWSNHDTFPVAKRAILMVRSPFAAIPSYVNWLYGFRHKKERQHQLQAPLAYWETWRNKNLSRQLVEWSKHFSYWVEYQSADSPLFIGKFEDLVGKRRGPETLSAVARFLDYPMDASKTDILWRKAMNVSSGVHRSKLYTPQYTVDQAALIETALLALRNTYGANNTQIASILDDYLSKFDHYIIRSNDT